MVKCKHCGVDLPDLLPSKSWVMYPRDKPEHTVLVKLYYCTKCSRDFRYGERVEPGTVVTTKTYELPETTGVNPT